MPAGSSRVLCRRGRLVLAMLLLWMAVPALAQVVRVMPDTFSQPLGADVDVYIDHTHRLGIEEIAGLAEPAFTASDRRTPNYSFSPHAYWFRVRLAWDPESAGVYQLSQEYPLTDRLVLYRRQPDGQWQATVTGDQFTFASRALPVRAFAFPIAARPGEQETLFIAAQGAGTIQLDLHLASPALAQAASETRHLLFGLYFGALAVLLLYNLVLYASTRERVYLYYSLYVGGLGVTFFDINGLAFRYWWPQWPVMNTWFLAFSFIALHALAQFTRHFLALSTHWRGMDRLFLGFLFFNALALAGVWLAPARWMYPASQLLVLVVSLLCVVAGSVLWWQGMRMARWFTLASGTFVVGLSVYAIQNFGWIPVTPLSNYAVQLGSAIEMAVLSLALADRVRLVMAERVDMEFQARRALQDSNQRLEERVDERTRELQASLTQLHEQHERLIAAQQQLVQAEKMSSLGGLVAGVAHEINNPAHFTRIAADNIARELGRLREDLKTLGASGSNLSGAGQAIEDRLARLGEQLSLIHDGTTRLAQIVGDLRLFSRQGDAHAREARPDEGLAATLNLVRAQYAEHIDIALRQSNPTASGVCYPAALNQVFLNLAVNACQAVVAAGGGSRAQRGWLVVDSRLETAPDGLWWVVDFRDNGPGIPGDLHQHVFEPFFTTKSAGEGTGLGLSVSYGIVHKHGGRITLVSVPGEGALFTVRIPLRREVDTPAQRMTTRSVLTDQEHGGQPHDDA